METPLPRDSRFRTVEQDRLLQLLQTLGDLMPPAPGAQVSVESLAEACRLEDAGLATVLRTLEGEGWLLRQDERTWELTLKGAQVVEQSLPRKDRARARRIRSEVLDAMCQSETAERDMPVHYRRACATIDAQSGELRAAIRWLVAEGYLYWYHVGGYVSCTRAGKEAQRRGALSRGTDVSGETPENRATGLGVGLSRAKS